MESNREPRDRLINKINYLMITYNGKESEKEKICISESLCSTPEMNTIIQQLYFNLRNAAGVPPGVVFHRKEKML